MSRVVELIKEFCEKRDDCDFYGDYSGRGMFGRTCVGIVVTDNLYMNVLIDLVQFFNDNDLRADDLDTEGMSVDNMGLDYIVYFPRIKG